MINFLIYIEILWIHKDFDLFESNNVYHAIIPVNSDINHQLNIVDEYM